MSEREISMELLMRENSQVFHSKLNEVIKPRFDVNNTLKYSKIVSRVLESNRKSFAMQAQKIAAIASEFDRKKQKSIILSAEMGSGKSDMASKIAVTIAKKRYVNFIMCPPHLVSKWEDELRLSETKDDKFKIIQVDRWEDLAPYSKRDMRKDGIRHFFIISRESAKLGYPKVEVFNLKKKKIIEENSFNGEMESKWVFSVRCPDCNNEFEEVNDIALAHSPRKCPECNNILRAVDKSVSKKMQTRIPIAEYIKRHWTKGKIELLIVDEIHEYKGGATGQGNALAQMASMSKKILGLTGTLLNGYASSLFYILYRLNPYMMKKRLGFDYDESKQFVEQFGAFEKIFKSEDANEGVIVKKGRMTAIKEKAKISPHLLSVLMDMVVFLRLDEIKMEKGEGLPSYKEEIVLVKKDDEIFKEADSYINDIVTKVRKDSRFLGNLANDSICIYDMPFQTHSAQGEIFYTPTTTREEYGYTNKEKELISLVKNELSQDRKVLIYIYFSNKGVGKDIQDILTDKFPNKKIRFLPPTIPAKKRQSWIRNNPCDVLICNPELVKTGLDLLEFPTIIFYETTYNIFTLKQASRRSWRLGQKESIKVLFMAYENTPQHIALNLIGAKVNAANSLEGRLSGDDDLASMGEDDSIQVALAKAILKGGSTNTKVLEKIELESFENFGGERDWNPFEIYYLENKNSKLNEPTPSPLNKEENEYTINVMDHQKQMKVYFNDHNNTLHAGDKVLIDDKWHELIYSPEKDDLLVDDKSVFECKIIDRRVASVPTHGMVVNYFNRRALGDTHQEAVNYAGKYGHYTPIHIVEYVIRYYKTDMIKNRYDLDRNGERVKDEILTFNSLLEYDGSITSQSTFYYYKKKGKSVEKVVVESTNVLDMFSDEELSKGIQLSLF